MTKGKFPGEHHMVWTGKQNIQAKQVYYEVVERQGSTL